MKTPAHSNSVKSLFAALLKDHKSPRALLVTLGDDGQLEHQPVAFGESVLDIEKDLIKHLNEYVYTTEWMVGLRDYIDCRLAARKEAIATGGFCTPREDGGFNIVHINAFEPITGVQ